MTQGNSAILNTGCGKKAFRLAWDQKTTGALPVSLTVNKAFIEKMEKQDRDYKIYHQLWYIKIIDSLEEIFWFPVVRLWDKVIDIPNIIKDFIMRGMRGYADSDLWSLDSYLSSWLPAALKQLKEDKHGYPGDLTEKKWDKILDQMIEAFEIDYKILEYEYKDLKDFKRLDKIRRKGLQLFAEYYNNLWD